MKSSPPDEQKNGVSRRKFLTSFGLTSLGVAAAGGGLIGEIGSSPGSAQAATLGPEPVEISLNVNGQVKKLKVEPRTTLVEALRDHLGMTGTKIGCDRGACGACTVIVDGRTVNSCLTLALDAVGKNIQTVEGLESSGQLHAIQEAFIEHDALQCGFCTSGMLMSCKHLLESNKKPSLEQIKKAVSGNLCRCGTYNKVFEAVAKVSK
jgi:xanthine dehydrogenase YagT iron-sulfur-binding subunit